MANSPQFKTPTARFSYVQNMFKRVTRTTDDGAPMLDSEGRPVTEQQCTLIFDATTDTSPFLDAAKAAIVDEWGDKGWDDYNKGLINKPFLKGDSDQAKSKKTGELHPGMGADKWFLRVATRREAPVRYRSKDIPARSGTGEDDVKSGDYGFAVLHAFTWNNKKKGRGVSFGIDYLQKTRAGEPLGGSGTVDPDQYYESLPDTGDAPASTKSGAGAGGLFGD